MAETSESELPKEGRGLAVYSRRQRRRLLAWYDRSRRELPWRRTTDPYRIWVSEIMLQQTRAESVAPYYERFLGRFPDVRALAAAESDEVLSLWSGLGYYRRARALLAGARQVMAAGGEVPRTARELRELPGVGPYTAAAVASIAYGEAVPVLDGNVVRVVTRLAADGGDPARAATRRRLLAVAGSLLDPGRPGDSNQALMELGATICTPRTPRCGECPLGGDCRAAADGAPEGYPRTAPRRAAVRERLLAARVERDGRVLLVRRPDDRRLLAGTWEVPWVAWSDDGAATRALGRRYGGSWSLGGSGGWVRHAITHRALEVEVRSATLGDGELGEGGPRREWAWVERGRLGDVPASSLVEKILRAELRRG